MLGIQTRGRRMVGADGAMAATPTMFLLSYSFYEVVYYNFFKYVLNPALFRYFQIILQEKTVGFAKGLRTWIIRVEDEHAFL